MRACLASLSSVRAMACSISRRCAINSLDAAENAEEAAVAD